jgi:predicted transposase/invertase (TIGR01784 family)
MLVENSAGEIVIIEIQNNSEVDYLFRMLYGVSKAVTEQMKLGDHYVKIRKVYHINILYFSLGEGNDYVYHGTTDFRGIHNNDILKLNEKDKLFFKKETPADLLPEYYILCVNDFNGVARNSLDEWIYYLKNTEIPETFSARGLKEAREQLVYDNLPEDEKKDYEHHVRQDLYEQNVIDDARYGGLVDGEAIGLKKGLEKGEAIGLEKVVIGSHHAGLPVEMISAITGLTSGQVQEILNRNSV